MTRDEVGTCKRCGRTIKVSDSAEAGLVAAGVLCEFYHCADRVACEQQAKLQPKTNGKGA